MTTSLPATQQQGALVPARPLMERVASRYGIDETKLLATLKATAFRVRDGAVSNEQMTALLIVADQYGLNPFTKELYAYPDKVGGIVPVVSVDGWARIINEHPKFDGMDFLYSDNKVKPKGAKDSPEWCKCILYRKDRNHPTQITEHLDEVFRELTYTNPWQTHTKRMLRHKALIQCARITFGFAGIYDDDEAQRIIEMEPMDARPTSGYLAAQPADRQLILHETATQIKSFWANDQAEDGYALIENSGFDAEETIALWSLLPSDIKSAHKRMKEVERAADAGHISPAQKKRLEARIKELGLDRDDVKAYCGKEFGVHHFQDLNVEQYNALDKEIETIPTTAPPPAPPPQTSSPAASDGGATYITDEQCRNLLSYCEQTGVNVARLLLKVKVQSVEQIPAEMYTRAIAFIDAAAKK